MTDSSNGWRPIGTLPKPDGDDWGRTLLACDSVCVFIGYWHPEKAEYTFIAPNGYRLNDEDMQALRFWQYAPEIE